MAAACGPVRGVDEQLAQGAVLRGVHQPHNVVNPLLRAELCCRFVEVFSGLSAYSYMSKRHERWYLERHQVVIL